MSLLLPLVPRAVLVERAPQLGGDADLGRDPSLSPGLDPSTGDLISSGLDAVVADANGRPTTPKGKGPAGGGPLGGGPPGLMLAPGQDSTSAATTMPSSVAPQSSTNPPATTAPSTTAVAAPSTSSTPPAMAPPSSAPSNTPMLPNTSIIVQSSSSPPTANTITLQSTTAIVPPPSTSTTPTSIAPAKPPPAQSPQTQSAPAAQPPASSVQTTQSPTTTIALIPPVSSQSSTRPATTPSMSTASTMAPDTSAVSTMQLSGFLTQTTTYVAEPLSIIPIALDPSSSTTATPLGPVNTQSRQSGTPNPSSTGSSGSPTLIPTADRGTTSGLSTSTKIGIGFGVTIFGILVLSGLIFCFWRRRKDQKEGAGLRGRIFSDYDPQRVYFGDGGEAGLAEKQQVERSMSDAAPLPPPPVLSIYSPDPPHAMTTGQGVQAVTSSGLVSELPAGHERNFSWGSEGEKEERRLAPGLSSHPTAARNAIERLGGPPFLRFVPGTSSSLGGDESQPAAGPGLYVVGGGTQTQTSSMYPNQSQDSLVDPNSPWPRSGSISPNDILPMRPSITPSESVSRVGARSEASSTPTPPPPPRVMSDNRISRMLAGASVANASSSASTPNTNILSVSELPLPPPPVARSASPVGSTRSQMSSPKAPNGMGVRAFIEMMRPKIRTVDFTSRWSSSRTGTNRSSVARSDSRDELIEKGGRA